MIAFQSPALAGRTESGAERAALQTLRDTLARPATRQRLECCVFSTAFSSYWLPALCLGGSVAKLNQINPLRQKTNQKQTETNQKMNYAGKLTSGDGSHTMAPCSQKSVHLWTLDCFPPLAKAVKPGQAWSRVPAKKNHRPFATTVRSSRPVGILYPPFSLLAVVYFASHCQLLPPAPPLPRRIRRMREKTGNEGGTCRAEALCEGGFPPF
jgi:hypothetical protein